MRGAACSRSRCEIVCAKLVKGTDLATEQDKRDLAVSLNLQRRHLNRAQRKEIIAALLTATPRRSDRWLAEICGVDHKTVGSVRRELELRKEIPKPDRQIGKDGKSYVRLEHGRYENEERRRDQERKGEIHRAVRKALRETPERTNQDVADEYDVTADYVADQRDNLEEHGPTLADVFDVKGPPYTRTAEETRKEQSEMRQETKRRKDQGELKGKDALRAFESIVELTQLLKLDHKNQNRRITPEDVAHYYAKDFELMATRATADVDERRAQQDLEKVANLQDWLNEFASVFARKLDEIL